MQQPDHLPDWLPADRLRSAQRFLTEAQIQFISCSYWRNRAPWEVAWRRVADTFCLFPVRGGVTVELDSGGVRLNPGQVLLLPDNTRHRLTLAPRVTRLEQIAVHCHLRNPWGLPLLALLAEPVWPLPATVNWIEQLRRLTCLAGRDRRAGQAAGELFIKELLLALIEAGAPVRWPAATIDPRIAAALQTIHERHAEDLSVRALAQTARLSEVRFRKQFQRDTGRSPRQYLIDYRLQTAARLLTQTALSIKEVAARCGFRSDHYFHRSFRAAHGATPSLYRRQALASGGRI